VYNLLDYNFVKFSVQNSSNTMTENSSTFWFLTFEYFKKDVMKPEDNLVILVHWLLLKNNFQVLGLDNEVNIFVNFAINNILLNFVG